MLGLRDSSTDTLASLAPLPAGAAELVLVGGGLQNALIVLATLTRHPEAHLTVIEREAQLGGNHTWCFHEADVPDSARAWLEPLVVRSWPDYEVRFPGHQRRVPHVYSIISSAQLSAVVERRIREAPNARLVTGEAVDVTQRHVTTAAGQTYSAALVIDARGPEPRPAVDQPCQKFLGLELEVTGNVPARPILMDATVRQKDGFRFVYVLPLSERRVLVEDTYYSDNAHLDRAALRAEVQAYAAAAGLTVHAVVREESGVLPLPLHWHATLASEGPLVAGYAGRFFHPTTGYSLPVAVRLAQHVAHHFPAGILGAELTALRKNLARQARFCVWLNRMLFHGFEPAQRFAVLERFYRLPEATIGRFYALDTTLADRARILCGRPPRGFSPRRLYNAGQYA